MNDLLVLAVSGQLNATYGGKIGVDSDYIPRYAGSAFEKDRKARQDTRKQGGARALDKRDKAGFKAMGKAARGIVDNQSFEYKILKAGTSESR